jgi:DNA repair protein RadD
VADPLDRCGGDAVPLRDYQRDGVAQIRDALRRVRRVVYALPTGGGKSYVFAYVVAGAVAKKRRALVLAHRAEILDQISAVLTRIGVPHGRVQPGHPATNHPVQVGSVMTVARRLATLPAPDLIVVDEAHHAVASSWARITEAWPGAYVLGVTATPTRLDGRGLRDAFDEMVEGPDVRALIDAGWLAEYSYYAPRLAVDLSGLRIVAGDYLPHDLAARLDRPTITGDAIAHYRRHLGGRTAIAFCCTVAHAEHVACDFRAAGIPAASIDGAMRPGERAALVEMLRCGAIRVLTSCDLISEGFDAPAVGGAILLRPTASLALHRQQIGRCLRPKGDGSRAVILDHVGNVDRHGLPDAPLRWTLDGRRSANADASDGIEGGGGGVRTQPDEIAGELDVIDPLPAWAGGLDIRAARGPEWRELLRRAAGREDRLRQIQVARGYHPGWIWHALSKHKPEVRA